MMKKISIIAVMLVFILTGGCNRLSLRESITHDQDDIPMFAYGHILCSSRVSVAEPPLDSIWDHDMGAGVGPYPPSAVDSMLFIGSLNGEIQIINISDGSLLGKKKMGSAIIGTPVVERNIVYLALTNTPKSVIAYDILGGSEIWSVRIGNIESSPLLLNSKLYVSTLVGDVYCIDAESGNIAWRFSIPVSSNRHLVTCSPVTDGNYIIVCSSEGNIISLSLEGGVAWKTTVGGGIVASPVVCGKEVFICSVDSFVHSFDIRTGKPMWETKLSSNIYSSPAVNERYVVVGCVDGTVWCLNRGNGEKEWISKTGGVLASSPLIAGDIIYTGDLENMFYGLSIQSGEVEYKRKFFGRIRTQPFGYKDYIFVFVEGRTLIGMNTRGQR